MGKKIFSVLLAGAIFVTACVPAVSAAENNTSASYNTQAVAEQTVTALEIMTRDKEGNMNFAKQVTRAQFAQMLAASSSFAGKVSSKANVSLFKDVNKNHPMSGYIKLAVSQGWMSGYLSGKFFPDKVITLEEAISAVEKLLGYSNTDFSGNLSDARYELYKEKELNQNIKLTQKGKMTRKDCMNLLYNVLTAATKEGRIYGETLGYSLDANGEIDYLKVVNKSLKGPYIVDVDWRKKIPFSLTGAKIYKNGIESIPSDLFEYDVMYYSLKQKTIWVYDDKVYGTFDGVTPNLTAPTAVTVAGKSYPIGNQKTAYALSNQGTYIQGMNITLLLGSDGTVAGIAEPEEISAEIIGCILMKGEHVTTSLGGYDSVKEYIQIVDTAGLIHEYDCDTSNLNAGGLVKVTFDERTPVVTSMERSTLDGVVDKKGTSIAGKKISPNAKIIDVVQGQFIKIYPSRLAGLTLGTSSVLYYAADKEGVITEIILNDVTGDLYKYGVMLSAQVRDVYSDPSSNFPTSKSGTYLFDIAGQQYNFVSDYAYFSSVEGPKSFLLDGTKISAVQELTQVPVSAVQNMQIVSGKKVYKIADNVSVYLQKNKDYYASKLSNISDLNKYTINGYLDNKGKDGGLVRVIVAKEHVRNEVR